MHTASKQQLFVYPGSALPDAKLGSQHVSSHQRWIFRAGKDVEKKKPLSVHALWVYHTYSYRAPARSQAWTGFEKLLGCTCLLPPLVYHRMTVWKYTARSIMFQIMHAYWNTMHMYINSLDYRGFCNEAVSEDSDSDDLQAEMINNFARGVPWLLLRQDFRIYRLIDLHRW